MASMGYVFDTATGKSHKGNQPKPETKISTPTPVEKNQTPRLDALGDFMVRTVERERDKIETELKELRTKYETLKQSKTEIEKQLEEATRALNEKPTGLSGIIQSNPDVLNQAMQMASPILAGIGEKLATWLTSQNAPKQLGEAATPAQSENVIWLWLKAQTPEVQEHFVMLLEKLDATKRTKDYLESWNRQLMAVVPKQNAR